MPFPDTLVKPEPYRTIATIVYRKPTHLDQYLQWNNQYNIAAESLVNTITHRAKTVCSIPQLLQEEEYLMEALKKCKYPNWALNGAKNKSDMHKKPSNNNTNKNTNNTAPTENKNTQWCQTPKASVKFQEHL